MVRLIIQHINILILDFKCLIGTIFITVVYPVIQTLDKKSLFRPFKLWTSSKSHLGHFSGDLNTGLVWYSNGQK